MIRQNFGFSYYNYKQVFTSNESYVFDEYNRINGIFHHNHFSVFEEVIFANINPAFTRFKCCRINNYAKQLFYFEKGKIFRAFINNRSELGKEEFIYIHLLGRKLNKVPGTEHSAWHFYIQLSVLRQSSGFRGISSPRVSG